MLNASSKDAIAPTSSSGRITVVGMLLSMFFAAKARGSMFSFQCQKIGTRVMYCILYTFYAARIGFAGFSMG